MKFSIKLSTFLLLTTAPVIAEELIVLDEITVTAGYTDTGISETGSSVSVLDQQELQYSSSGSFKRLKMLRVFQWTQLVG